MQAVDSYIDRLSHLPPSPRVLGQLLVLLNDPNVDADRVVELIGVDPGLTANVVRLARSAVWARGEPPGDLSEAVQRLGFQQIFQLVASSVGSRMLNPEQKGYGLERGDLWRHSVVSALASRVIARDLQFPENLAFTASLLHDVGKLVLAEALETQYEQFVAKVEQNRLSLLEAESLLLGVNHAEVGGRLLARWGFPHQLITAVTFHHEPADANGEGQLTSLVYLGNLVAYYLGYGFGNDAFAFRDRSLALEPGPPDDLRLAHYLIVTLEEYQRLETLFEVQRS